MLYELALCAGVGGIQLGLRRTQHFRTVCYVERNPYRVQVLRARMADGYLDDAPIWDDVTTFDGKPWCGCVDILTAGFPCQPFSKAGKRLGQDDELYLWPSICKIVRHVRPRFVFLENVPTLLTPVTRDDGTRLPAPLSDVLGGLAACGYDAQWQCLPASLFGTLHQRDRVFIVAYARQERVQGLWTRPIPWVQEFSWCQDVRRVEDLRNRSDLPEPLFRGAGDGIPHWIQRLEAVGEAVVPAIAEYIGNCVIRARSGLYVDEVAV